MPDKAAGNLQSRKPSGQLNVRLPWLTHDQVDALTEEFGLTKTQLIIIAVDRLVRDLGAGDEGAEKTVRRLKTVARIAPNVDLGEDG